MVLYNIEINSKLYLKFSLKWVNSFLSVNTDLPEDNIKSETNVIS